MHGYEALGILVEEGSKYEGSDFVLDRFVSSFGDFGA